MKLFKLLTVFVLLVTILTGCKTEKEVLDREGNTVVIPKTIETIISTAPSNTEVLVELGVGEKIIGVDKYSPLEGLNEVEVLDFRNPDAETIIALNPDIIIASGHNKTGGEDPFAPIKEAGITVVYIPSSVSFEGIYEDIKFMADIVGEKKKGESIINEMKEEVEKITEIAATITDKKKVYFEISPSPYIYTTGKNTFQNEIIETIGAINVFSTEEGWISPSEEAIIDANPDVIVTNVGYVANADKDILAREGWNSIKAITNGNVYLIDSNSSSRPSHNVIKALKEMAKAVYPEFYE